MSIKLKYAVGCKSEYVHEVKACCLCLLCRELHFI